MLFPCSKMQAVGGSLDNHCVWLQRLRVPWLLGVGHCSMLVLCTDLVCGSPACMHLWSGQPLEVNPVH